MPAFWPPRSAEPALLNPSHALYARADVWRIPHDGLLLAHDDDLNRGSHVFLFDLDSKRPSRETPKKQTCCTVVPRDSALWASGHSAGVY